jgi:phenylalanyl-tRNA synthetase beta chain
VRLFAVGARFLPPSGEEPSARAKAARPRSEGERRVLPEERPSFAAVVAGSRSSGLGGPRAAVDVYDAKGLAVELCERLTGRPAEVRHAGGRYAHLHPRATGEVLVGELVAGSFGTLHPDVVDAFDLGTTAHVVELDVTVLERLGYETPRHRPIPRLPPITRDVAFELDERVLAGDVVAAIRRAATDLCESVELFDVFQGGNIPSGRRSLAFRIVYRDPKARIDPEHARTLTDKEVDEQQSRVVKLVSDELGGVIRA